MINDQVLTLFRDATADRDAMRCRSVTIDGATVLDCGVETPSSIAAGLLLARCCLGDRADVRILPAAPERVAAQNQISVWTDHPVLACLGSQYAGWPVKTDDFFAMGSGPMRLARGREPMLDELKLSERASAVVGVLESDSLPTSAAVASIAEDCGVDAESVFLAVAPTSSIAGTLQVVARSIETALHKLHELGFDVSSVISATGHAPLPPPAKPGDLVAGIGRTNDAMLYGAEVTLWVDHDDDAIEQVAARVPSSSSDDHGEPFARVFKKYEYDFYKVDPMLFSPAVVTIFNLRTGRSWSHGQIETDILRQSFAT